MTFFKSMQNLTSASSKVVLDRQICIAKVKLPRSFK